MNSRLPLFASVFAVAIALDLVKFLALDKPTVINWESFVHPAWVIGAAVMLFLAARFPFAHRIALWLYLAVFVIAYLNVYLQFTETITYFCMIFNLVLTAVLFFSRPPSEDEIERRSKHAEGEKVRERRHEAVPRNE